MAEIHIERKQRSTWPWALLGLVLLALLLWWLLSRNTNRVATTDTSRGYFDSAAGAIAPPSHVAPAPAAAATAFIAFNDSIQSRGDKGVDTHRTAMGIRRLASALRGLVGVGATGEVSSGQSMQARIDSLGKLADSLQRLPASESGRITHDAFTRAASIMTQLQQNSYPGARDEVHEVRDAAEDVEPDEPIAKQRDDVREFFGDASKAVRAMTNPGV